MAVSSVRAPAEVARAAFDAVIAGDPDRIVEQGAPDIVDDFVAIGEFRGRESVRGFFQELRAAFPDYEMHVDRIIADDKSAVVQWHAAGTFTGSPFQGIEASGRRVAVRGVDVMDIAGGLIRHNTIYYDGASFARQVGLLPRKDSAAERGLLAAFNGAMRGRRRLRRPG